MNSGKNYQSAELSLRVLLNGIAQVHSPCIEWSRLLNSESEKGEVVLKVLRKIMKFSNEKDEKLA